MATPSQSVVAVNGNSGTQSNESTTVVETVTESNLPEPTEPIKDAFRISTNQFVLIQMPSGNVKTVSLKPSSTVSLGKFGSFKSDDLAGKPYDVWYEIHKDTIRQIPNWELSEVEETDANNQLINDCVTTQKLTHEEVEKLKKEAHDGSIKAQEIIKRMIESHSDFEKKTEYSKAKYIQRKKKKHSHRFKPVRPTVFTIAQHFFTKNVEKTKGLRVDTLSQLLSVACIRANSKLLVIDDTQGMIVGAIAERMGGFGTVVGLHDGDNHNYDILRYLNFPDSVTDTIYPLTLSTAESDNDPPCPENLADAAPKQKKRYERKLLARQMYQQGGFDGLIISSQFTPESVIKRLVTKINGSRPIVVYSPNKETLIDAAAYMRRSGEFINVDVSESFLRQYQVLPGRTHPQMNMSGGGGYLLSALRIIDTRQFDTAAEDDVVNKKARYEE